MIKFTEQQIREAEHLLMFQATHNAPTEVRARARVTVALIALLDAQKVNWRQDLAEEIQTKLSSGELTDFNPDKPFELDFANVDDMLSKLSIGDMSALEVKDNFGTRF